MMRTRAWLNLAGAATLLAACGGDARRGTEDPAPDDGEGPTSGGVETERDAAPRAGVTDPPRPNEALDGPPGRATDAPAALPDAAVPSSADAVTPPEAAAPDAQSSRDLPRLGEGNLDVSPESVGWKSCDGSPVVKADGSLVALKIHPDVPLRLGAGAGGVDPLPADLDRVRLYNRALTQDEVLAHVRGQYEPCTAAAGCVLELGFDDLKNGTFADSGPNGLSVVVKGTPQLADGVEGMSARFDGKWWIEIKHDKALELTRALTFEAWERRYGDCPAGLPGTCEMMRMFDKTDDLRLDMHGGLHRFVSTAGLTSGSGLPSKNVWQHVAFTLDEKVGVMYFKNAKVSRACTLR